VTRAWAAVVVTYEAGPLLVECVRSVLADSSAGEVELVVVDNGSSDGSVDALRREIPDAHVITAPGNLGYSRAANLGIAATRAPIVAVMNSDLTVEAGTA
jgi:N-acetylglucosaminyl-diphospho-decaprenol L-rhamnosyltransferase